MKRIVMTCLLVACQAFAAPPAGVTFDPELSAWYRSLKDGRGIGCCSEADCRPVEYRTHGREFEVFIDRATFGPGAPDNWVVVPREAILTRENPSGVGVACWYDGQVRCFVQAGAT